MKTKFLFWSAVVFLILGLITADSTLFFFFSIHFFTLFIGVFVHTMTHKFRTSKDAESLPEARPTIK